MVNEEPPATYRTYPARRARRTSRSRRPWHLWFVAIFVLALGLGGARDFLLILWQDQDYLHTQFSEDGIVYFTDYPWRSAQLGQSISPDCS